MSVKKTLITSLVTAVGSGFSPRAPGTAASLLLVISCYAVSRLHMSFFLTGLKLLFLIVLIAGVPLSSYAEKNIFFRKDDPRIVIDEICGMLIPLMLYGLMPISIEIWYALSFVFFRFFDILKPLGINSLQKLNGGWGVMLDDVAAGFAAAVSVHLTALVIQ